MERYIDAENMKKEVLKRSTSPLNEWDTWGVLNVLDMVETADVAPVTHAHWIIEPYPGDFWRHTCSNPKCKHYEFHAYKEYRGSNYCPDCGAKMDEEVSE